MSISKAQTFRNITYTACTKGLTLFCLGLTSMVVARNLTASDYGVVGFATIIIGFLSRFSDMGIGSAAIRRPSMDQSSLHTAFTLKLILSIVAFLAAMAVAPFARRIFAHPATGNVIRILALNFLLSTIGFLPLVMLTREMNYRRLMIPGVVTAAAQAVIAIVLVLHGWKYWAVVLGNVGATLAGGMAMQLMRKLPVRLQFDRPSSKEYLRFGVPLFGSGILVFLIFNLDNFLVGMKLGSTELGYYALAFTWGSFICILLNDTVNNVLFPTFATIQHDLTAMRRWYIRTVDLVAFIAVVANTTLLANARFFLITFLGKGTQKWIPALVPLTILCVYGMLRAITEPAGPCLMARGLTNTLLYANLAGGAVEVILLLLALEAGRIDLVAAAVLLSYGCAAGALLPFLRREFAVGIIDIFLRIWPVLPASIVGYMVTSLLPDSFGSTIVTLAARGLFTASAAALVHGLCTRFRCFHEASAIIFHNFARARA